MEAIEGGEVENMKMRIWQRHLYYFQIGWSMYLWYVLDFISAVTVIYVLLLSNIPFVQTVFPDIVRFALAAVLIIFVVSDLFGWLHFHTSGIYAAQQDIVTENNPFNYEMLVRSLLPFMRVTYELGKTAGLDHRKDLSSTMRLCEEIIAKSEARWKLKEEKK
jgi:hypothetical protein